MAGACDENSLAEEGFLFKPSQFLAQSNHFAYDNDGGRFKILFGSNLYDILKISHQCLLFGRRAPLYQSHRLRIWTSIFEQLFYDKREIFHPHQEHQCINARSKLIKIYMRSILFLCFMSGDCCEAGSHPTMCDWNAGISWRCDSRTDAWNHFEGNIVFGERLCFFPTASKNEWVAPF